MAGTAELDTGRRSDGSRGRTGGRIRACGAGRSNAPANADNTAFDVVRSG